MGYCKWVSYLHSVAMLNMEHMCFGCAALFCFVLFCFFLLKSLVFLTTTGFGIPPGHGLSAAP